MDIRTATDATSWDDFVSRQSWSPFLQSWTMGEVYADIGQPAVRIQAQDENGIRAVCFGHIVLAKRGKHLSIPYGPLLDHTLTETERFELVPKLFEALSQTAKEAGCSFLRMSPFLTDEESSAVLSPLQKAGIKTVSSPLHLLAEHVWYIPLQEQGEMKSEETLRAAMRKTTRNLIGRATRDGVTVEASKNIMRDLPHFMALHDETRKRHGFTPYSDRFFHAQAEKFGARGECTLYLAWYEEKVIAASLHMHAFGETSYHHGASSSAYHKIPASYLLQWTAIQDALKRGDRIYNFWGIAPLDADGNVAGKLHSHPFGGVTLFKTGFGGTLHNLMHCRDVPLTKSYWLTYAFEHFRKWRRGF